MLSNERFPSINTTTCSKGDRMEHGPHVMLVETKPPPGDLEETHHVPMLHKHTLWRPGGAGCIDHIDQIGWRAFGGQGRAGCATTCLPRCAIGLGCAAGLGIGAPVGQQQGNGSIRDPAGEPRFAAPGWSSSPAPTPTTISRPGARSRMASHCTRYWSGWWMPGWHRPRRCGGAASLAADTFGLTDRGVIALGRRADLVLVDGGHTRDISATRNIRGVWIGGRRVKPNGTT